MSRALFAALSLGLASAASAQPLAPDATPAFGTLTPGASATEVSFDARTPTELVVEGAECTGYVDPSAPDVVVEWGGGDLQLWVRAAFDATMAVSDPEGRWSCDDDTNGTMPVVAYEGAPAGRYAVWVGAFAPDPADASATLYAGPPPPPPVLDVDAPAQVGVIEASGGFEDSQGAITVTVEAGGEAAVQALDLGPTDTFCAGYIDATAPTATIDYDADGGTGVLTVGATALDDLVLVVRAPDGEVFCNDDFDGTDPLVQLDAPASGAYAVWVGTYGMGLEPVDATLTVGESDAAGDVFGDGEIVDEPYGTPYSEGAYAPLDLDAAPAVRIAADDEEGASAEVQFLPAAPNPVNGLACAGYVESGPTAGVELQGDGPFAITASSDDDLTLVVRTPSGGWFCSDDAYDLDPGVQIGSTEAGLYLVWVGAFSDGGGVPFEATLAAEPGELEVSATDYGMGGGPAVDPQSDGVYSGSEIVGGASDVTLSGDETGAAEVMAGGTVWNPVDGAACHGYLSMNPSATLDASGPVTVSATADDDLTLVVQAPDGSWTCSDDADGSDPRATVEGGAGTYSVWVGTYFRRTTPVSATLRVE